MGFLRTATILCILAVVGAFILRAFEKEKLPILVNGTVEPGFEDAITAFRANFESEDVEPREGGSAFAAYYKGKQVVNLWGGYADYESGQPWREDTMAIVASVTKGMAALCAAILVDRGHLDYNQKVVHYWPEFGQKGKENVTVKMLLNHEAGLAVIGEQLTLDLLKNYENLGKALAASPPMWELGTAHGYHALTFGLYVSQLISRADPNKRPLRVFFKEEVTDAFGIDFHIGLPLEQNYRVSRYFTGLKPFRSFLRSLQDPHNREFMWKWTTGEARIQEVVDNAKSIIDFTVFNDPENRAIECGSASGIGTAESLAKVYGILAIGGKTLDGKQLLSAERIEQLQNEAAPMSVDVVLGLPSQFSHGFFKSVGYKDKLVLGHPGAGGNNAYADFEQKLGFGFVTRYGSAFGLGNDPRFTSVRDVVYQCVDKLNAGK